MFCADGSRCTYSTSLVAEPRDAAASTIPATTDDQMWFGRFRIGVWPDYFPGVQFSRDPDALDQYFRAMTPNTGPTMQR